MRLRHSCTRWRDCGAEAPGLELGLPQPQELSKAPSAWTNILLPNCPRSFQPSVTRSWGGGGGRDAGKAADRKLVSHPSVSSYAVCFWSQTKGFICGSDGVVTIQFPRTHPTPDTASFPSSGAFLAQRPGLCLFFDGGEAEGHFGSFTGCLSGCWHSHLTDGLPHGAAGAVSPSSPKAPAQGMCFGFFLWDLC